MRWIVGLLALVISPTASALPWTLDCLQVGSSVVTNDTFDGFETAKNEKFAITFSRINDEDWMMTGNLGSVPVVGILASDSLHLLENAPLGGINMTAVELEPDEDGHHRAIHSRHTVLLGDLTPSIRILQCASR